MKKNYQKPAMQVVNLQPVTILEGSPDQQAIVKSIQSSDGTSEGSVDIDFGGGGSEPARSRGIGDWED